MTIEDLINQITTDDFKEDFGDQMSSNGLVLVDEWKSDKTYNIGDICYTTNANYAKILWSSTIDENTNNTPSPASTSWKKYEKKLFTFYITDKDIEKQMAIRKEILFDLCYQRNFNVKDVGSRIKELYGLFICAGLLSEKDVYADAGLVNSTSIAGTSKSMEFNDFVRKYPWLDNSFGIQAYQIMISLFSYDYRLLEVVKNNPYDY